MRAPAGRFRCRAALVAALACTALPLGAQQRVDKEGTGAIVKGAEGLPDLQRGKMAAAAGRVEEAERDLVPLSERGYVDAQLALGRLYSHQDTKEANAKAIRWLREAAEKTPDAEVSLARALVRAGDAKDLANAEHLFDKGWSGRQDTEALSGLLELYAANPALDRQHRAPQLAAEAEKLDRPATTSAVIRWYRATQDQGDHAAKLLTLCRRSLDLAPECYVDLVRAARAKGDKETMTQLVHAAMSQFGQDRVPFNVAAGIARSLVSTPDDDEPEAAPVMVSDVPEVDAGALAPVAHVGGVSGAASAMRSCAQDPIGVVQAVPQTPAPAAASAAPVTASGSDNGSLLGDTPATATATSAPAAKAASAAPPADANADPRLANEIIAKLGAGSTEARVEAAGVVVRYPFLAPDFDIQGALDAGRKEHIADATLSLGQLNLYGQRATRDPKAALAYLEEAAKVPDTAVEAHYFLGRLYQYGYLDEVDPNKAQTELLEAARQGYIPADGALARLYASAKGTCANRVDAYVFAELGVRGGTDAMRTLRDELKAALAPADRASAEQLLQRERATRTKSERSADLAAADTKGGQP
jgi:TPR repeat protein